MPLTLVRSKPGILADAQKKVLGLFLQKAVAEVLDVKEDDSARLVPADIEVRFSEVGPFDVNASDLAIEIFASDYYLRRANIQGRAEWLAKKLHEMQSGMVPVLDRELFGKNNFVWILLAPAGFATI